ncbi:peptide chain release factor [Dehalogenimonas formicexedens]|uniref:Peptide chain release factor 3 n=1 Tax=Dehalogenimonas formicexedens TaxID=1839801 RepID=A0A1P8F683_9CHLR|nr:peptide chain release factor 3 [Dehalogenimonas formicexedens]APV43997.1 peptide chain release factor [Dehalogenimonas formicexedens]
MNAAQETKPDNKGLKKEVSRRRTFAIISHPDAGKTTLTEKFLLYAGAVELAGSVRARASQQHTASDWMTMERQRGISISATALEMEYQGFRINLLDTPGHQDFSEDTYRTLMAADSAVMVLDSAKGIEAQTEKLFRVCRMRGVPILTFINKMDHPGRDPLALLDEIERILGIAAVPMNWPVGEAPSFQGVYDLRGNKMLRFQRTEHNRFRAPVQVSGIDDPALPELLGQAAYDKLVEDASLLSGAVAEFDLVRFLNGTMTPVFFGSALNNFGVEAFLNAVLELAPAPVARETEQGVIDPASDTFRGFVFKLQANIDPRHRDRMAFVRVCSGKFEKDMLVLNPRLKQEIRLSRAFKLFGRERVSVDEAFPGDVIGVVSPGLLSIGDTVTTGKPIDFAKIPVFPPEHFAILVNDDVTRFKQFNKGLEQLEEEGAIQVLNSEDALRREPIVAAVGELQFDVVLSRLEEEYGVKARVQRLGFCGARWIRASDGAIPRMSLSTGMRRCRDKNDGIVVLYNSKWELEYFQKENPGLILSETS